MRKTNIILSVLIMTIALLSSCSKPKYTASFTPSKSVKYTKVEKPVITKENIVKKEDAVIASKTQIDVPVVEKQLVKPSNLNEKNTASQSTFDKVEMKQMKKEVRKTVFKEVKNNLFKKKSGDVNIIHVILALFPILCLIGIYLHQGENITNDFWLDLVLHLTVIGEIIYALLVVLDIVTIA